MCNESPASPCWGSFCNNDPLPVHYPLLKLKNEYSKSTGNNIRTWNLVLRSQNWHQDPNFQMKMFDTYGTLLKKCVHAWGVFDGFRKVRKWGQKRFFFLQRQTSLRPILSTWFSASIIQTDVHKILSRRASQFASPECLP